MLPSAPSQRDLPPPPDEGAAPAGTSPKVARNAKWALGGLAVAGLAYVAAVDPEQPNLVPGCAFAALTGADCPGCGGTRAVHALLRGDVVDALGHNALVVVALAVAVVGMAVRAVGRRIRPDAPRRGFTLTRRWGIVLLVTVGSFWVLRNLPWSPFDWFASAN